MYVPSSELGLPHPFGRKRVYPPPPGPKGGGAHSPSAKGVRESQFRRLEKKLGTLPTLCINSSQSPMLLGGFSPAERMYTKRPTIVFFLVPRNLSNHMIMQARTGDTVLVKSREMTEPVFLNVYGAQESIPRNEFRQPM